MINLTNRKIKVGGIVQGVGFRPFIFRLAKSYDLNGFVINNSDGVIIAVEGDITKIKLFTDSIQSQSPKLSRVDFVQILSEKNITNTEYTSFSIEESVQGKSNQTLISPDCVTCQDCIDELFDPRNRRYKYPFINCTNCGPRFSIITNIPYDRPLTTMKDFKMCEICQSEYNDPSDRRFHAQPNACWDCGPSLELTTNTGVILDVDDPVAKTVDLIKSGQIVALKGLGGYNLILDPRNDETVNRLRKLKKRPAKPLAVMGYDVEKLKKLCKITNQEIEILSSVARPIVLCQKLSNPKLSSLIAPGSKYFGVMLPNNPLQFLLLKDLEYVVCTSANISNRPMEYKDDEAEKNLVSIADFILRNDRDINTRVDDSIVIFNHKTKKDQVIRRARGYVPLPFKSPLKIEVNGLALGAELKNTVCINRKNEFFVSHNNGDLKNQETFKSYQEQIKHLGKILEVDPQFLACDLHPGFLNTQNLDTFTVPIYRIQHHHAHMASCMFENNITEPVIGVIFDGVGYGDDGNLWGGEFLTGDYCGFKRFGNFDYFNLLGGDKAVKEPFRIALNLLQNIYGSGFRNLDLSVIQNRTTQELDVFEKMSMSGLNSFKTSSVGRLFDGVSALLGIREYVEYEAQAAIELENQIVANELKSIVLPYKIKQKNLLNSEFEVDFSLAIREMVDLIVSKRVSVSTISRSFHDTIANVVLSMCKRIRDVESLNSVVFSGGVFQNQYLLNKCITLCKDSKFDIFTHSKVPSNDGGISLGQGIIAAKKFQNQLLN